MKSGQPITLSSHATSQDMQPIPSTIQHYPANKFTALHDTSFTGPKITEDYYSTPKSSSFFLHG